MCKRILWPSVLALVLSFGTLPAGAESTPSNGVAPAEIAVSANGDIPQAGKVVRPRAVSPLVAALLAVIEEEQKALAGLRGQIAQTLDNAQALDLQRQVEAIKRETGLTLLRIQAVHARREGRLEAAAQLDAIVLQLTAPTALPIPALPANAAAAQ